jgi:hypothetical protein
MAMASIYEKDRPSLQEYLGHFSLIGSQVGAVFLINGKVVGMDGFGKTETFSKAFKKLVESYALDAVDWLKEEGEHKASRSEVTKFIAGTFTCSLETHGAIGLGTDCRLESGKMTGFALSFDDKVIHMSIFARLEGLQGRAQTSRMARFSRRNQNRVY